MSINRSAKKNYQRLADLLLSAAETPRVLILGGSILGAGIEEFRADGRFDFLDTDVAFGPFTKVICDAHDIPLPDRSVDAVVLQAVLEHLIDPYRVVGEVKRVLKPEGFVYAETPFLQEAHATPYDFHRFTYVGYRRLFAHFSLIEMGPVGGPGQAMGHLYEHLLQCLAVNRGVCALFYIVARFTGFWLKYLDRLMNRHPHAICCAFGLYFLGQLREAPLSDREVIAECRKY